MSSVFDIGGLHLFFPPSDYARVRMIFNMFSDNGSLIDVER